MSEKTGGSCVRKCGCSSLLCRSAEALRSPITDSGALRRLLWITVSYTHLVLYLCLEDSFQRIQSRLFDLTEDAPPTLHFAVMSQQLHNGLVEQIEQFLKEHPQTRLIVIDTLQRCLLYTSWILTAICTRTSRPK